MDGITRGHFDNIHSSDRALQGVAYAYLIGVTSSPVGWACGVLDELVEALSLKDNRRRTIAGQLL